MMAFYGVTISLLRKFNRFIYVKYQLKFCKTLRLTTWGEGMTKNSVKY